MLKSGTGKLVRNITIKLKGVLCIVDLELRCWLGRFGLRGKLWSIDQERQLRELLKAGVGVAEIGKVLGKSRASVRSKIYHLGLCVVDAAALQPVVASIASTPHPVVERNPPDNAPLEAPIVNTLPQLIAPLRPVREMLMWLLLDLKLMAPCPA